MPKTEILRGQKTFKSFFKENQRLKTQNFDILYSPSTKSKIAVIAKKKLIPLATHRNYVKRLVKEICRKEIMPKIQNNYILVFIPTNDLLLIDEKDRYAKIVSEIRNALLFLIS